MEYLRADDLPAFLDPLLNYLSRKLPEPIYEALLSALSHSLALIAAGLSFISSLGSWKPWEWDAQKVLPPLISFLLAYYALVSIYRTTGWMVRMTFRLLKWGSILSLFFGALGWMMGSTEGGIGGVVTRLISSTNGGSNGPRGASRQRGSPYGTRQRPPRPKAWESFNAHRQWEYREEDAHNANEDRASDVERVIRGIVSTAGRVVTGLDMNFLGTAQNFLRENGFTASKSSSEGGEDTHEKSNSQSAAQPKRRAQTKAQKRTRSR